MYFCTIDITFLYTTLCHLFGRPAPPSRVTYFLNGPIPIMLYQIIATTTRFRIFVWLWFQMPRNRDINCWKLGIQMLLFYLTKIQCKKTSENVDWCRLFVSQIFLTTEILVRRNIFSIDTSDLCWKAWERIEYVS